MRRAGLAALLMLTMDIAQAQYWGSPYSRGGCSYGPQPGYSLFGLLGRRLPARRAPRCSRAAVAT
jgi:hypothetical protein